MTYSDKKVESSRAAKIEGKIVTEWPRGKARVAKSFMVASAGTSNMPHMLKSR
jgi:hypothetical protein